MGGGEPDLQRCLGPGCAQSWCALNVQVHTIVLDRVYVTERSGALGFRPFLAPARRPLNQVVREVVRKVCRAPRRLGLEDEAALPDSAVAAPELAALVRETEAYPRERLVAPERARPTGDARSLASADGFNLHSGSPLPPSVWPPRRRPRRCALRATWPCPREAKAGAAPPIEAPHEAAEVLAARSRDASVSTAERARDLEALGALAHGAVEAASPALRKALDDPEAAIRAAAARASARIGQEGGRSKGLFYRVTALLNDREPEVRAAAVLSAAALAPEKGVAALVLVRKREKAAKALVSCGTALGARPEPEARTRARALAESGDAAVREAALRALAVRSEPEAADFVRGRLGTL